MTDIINQYLIKDEKILWAGQPRFPHLKGETAFVPALIFFCGMMFLWVIESAFKKPMGYQIYIIWFVFIAVYMVFGRLLFRWYIIKHTFYYVTNQRVIALKRTHKVTVQDIALFKIKNIEMFVNREGLGMLRFGATPRALKFFEGIGLVLLTELYRKPNYAPSFHNIINAEKVYQLVETMRTKV